MPAEKLPWNVYKRSIVMIEGAGRGVELEFLGQVKAFDHLGAGRQADEQWPALAAEGKTADYPRGRLYVTSIANHICYDGKDCWCNRT